MDVWNPLLPSAEIDTVEMITPELRCGCLPGWTSPTLYAVLSGSWNICFLEAAPSEGESDRQLSAGDVLVMTQQLRHQLEFKSPGTFQSGEAQCLRIGFHWDYAGHEDRFSLLPSIICSQNLLPLSHTGSLAEVTAADFPASQQGLIFTLAQLLIGQAIGAQTHELKSLNGRNLDPEVEQTLRAMEQKPGLPWTIERMAEAAGISRSALAQKFKDQVGQTPNEHLLNVRMRLADQMLKDRRHHLKEIARRSGYQSVSAFSTAFKRWSGYPPSAYRKGDVTPK